MVVGGLCVGEILALVECLEVGKPVFEDSLVVKCCSRVGPLKSFMLEEDGIFTLFAVLTIC